jgi:hypothetical protein
MRFSAKSMNRQLYFPNNIYIAIDALKISIKLSSGDNSPRRVFSLMVV